MVNMFNIYGKGANCKMTGKNHWHVMPHIWYKYQRLAISAIDISYPFILIYDSVCIFFYQQKILKKIIAFKFCHMYYMNYS